LLTLYREHSKGGGVAFSRGRREKDGGISGVGAGLGGSGNKLKNKSMEAPLRGGRDPTQIGGGRKERLQELSSHFTEKEKRACWGREKRIQNGPRAGKDKSGTFPIEGAMSSELISFQIKRWVSSRGGKKKKKTCV